MRFLLCLLFVSLKISSFRETSNVGDHGVHGNSSIYIIPSLRGARLDSIEFVLPRRSLMAKYKTPLIELEIGSWSTSRPGRF